MGMSYINESLAPNETLIYFARFHWLRKAVAYAALAVFVVIAMASLVLVQDWPGLLGAAVVSVVGLAVFIAMMMPIWTTEIGVTNHRFILKSGAGCAEPPMSCSSLPLRKSTWIRASLAGFLDMAI